MDFPGEIEREIEHAKQELRRGALNARRARSADQLALARRLLRTVVLEVARDRQWRSVAAYEPLPTEPGSTELLARLTDWGLRVLVPITLPDNDLDWRQWNTTQPLGKNAITQVDAMLIPALAVARDGTRLGRGGGSYDRCLARVGPHTPLAALLFVDELVEELPSAAWDVPVTATAQPTGWRDLR